MRALENALAEDPILAGRVLVHYLDLALQSDQIVLADSLSRRIVEVFEEDRRLGARSPYRRAGAPPPAAAHLLRGGVLIRLDRLDEARASLERQLQIVTAGLGTKWTEASAIRGLLRIAALRDEPPWTPLVRRLASLEAEYAEAIAQRAIDPLILPGSYRATDPIAGVAWLHQAAPPTTFRDALLHAVLYHMAGEGAAARRALAAVPPSAQWERACAHRVALALAD
jgi:hypothetical protein